MGVSKDKLLEQLQKLRILFSQYKHPAVLTVEAQARYVGNLGGGLSKNLFLKVPLGCVTPFAVVNESARDVSLLLDQGFKTQEFCFFHPLSNDMSISLNARDLDKFLKSIGRDPSYVDLEANPSVGKDQPPDLASLVPSNPITLLDQPEKQSSSQQPSSQVPKDINNVSVDNKSNMVLAKVVKPSKGGKNTKETPPVKNVNSSKSYADVGHFVEEIMQKTSELLLSEIKDEQLGTLVYNKLQKNLSSDLKNLAMIFKNTAYTEGFHAGTRGACEALDNLRFACRRV